MSLASTLSVGNAANFLATVTIAGATSLASTLTVGNAANFSATVTIAGAVSLASTLAVGNAANFASTVTVVGAAHLQAAVSVGGATQFSNTLTVGVDDTGHDVKFFGATSGAYMLWDESADDLILGGDAGMGVGTTNTPSNKDTVTPKLVVNGAGVKGAMQIVRNTSPGGGGSILEMTATRGTDVNSYTIVQNGDGLGTVSFGGADGNEFVAAAQIQGSVDGVPGDNDMPGRLMFSTTADGAATVTEHMRITNGGFIGIGTTAPNATTKVHIVGSSTDANSALDLQKGSGTTTTSQVFVRFFAPAGSGSITANGASAATFTGYSDRRLKENIKPLSSQLDNIMALKPSEFDFREGSGYSGHQIGFIAQEFQEVYPDAVIPGDDGMLQIAGWSKQEARLVSALQGAVEKINQLEERIALLEGK